MASSVSSINIVALIESNKLTKLDDTYNNKLLIKIKNNFTNDEHQLFIASFYCYLNYKPTDFVVDLDDIWKWLGFSTKQKAKLLLEKQFIIDIHYKKIPFQGKDKNEGRGGHNKESFMLNTKTFKIFCIKADTKKANEIHEYFVKLEEILESILEEECQELKLKMQNAALNESNNNISKISEIEKEKVLLHEYANCGPIIYIVRVKSFENGEYIVKIGESRVGISERYKEHKSKYEEAVLLYCLRTTNSKDFEYFIHTHKDIKINKVTHLKGHETERELFLIGKDLTFERIITIINIHHNNFNGLDPNKIYNGMEKMNDGIEKMNDKLQHCIMPSSQEISTSNISENSSLENLIKLLLHKVEKLENINEKMNEKLEKLEKIEKSNEQLEKTNAEILEKLNGLQTKTTTNFGEPLQILGPKLQKINPETLNLVKVYQSVTECLRETNHVLKRPSLNKAIKECTIYKGFRWQYIDRNLNENVIHNLQPTRKTQPQNGGYLAKLNKDKTKIVAVYLDKKTACFENGFQSSSALYIPIKNEKITNEHYYKLYDDCSDELKDKFIEKKNNGNEVVLYKDGVGQYDPENEELLIEFVCKHYCSNSLGISDKSLTKAIDQNIPYNGHYYRRLGEKLVIQ